MFSSITSRIPVAPVRRRSQLSLASVTRSLTVAGNNSAALNVYVGTSQGASTSTIFFGTVASNGLTSERIYRTNTGDVAIMTGNAQDVTVKSGLLSMSSTGALGVSTDTRIYRDAVGVFALRNTTTAHSLRIYNTTDAGLTNYERGFAEWVSSEFLIGTTNAGTGAARPVKFQTSGTTRGGITTAGSVYVGSGAGALATTATDGFLYIPTCAGLPTGTPTAITGSAPLVADSTNNRVYCYLGGAWVALN